MNKHELIYLAEKYAAKKANSQERLAVDIFLRKVQEQGTHPFVNLDEEKRNKLFSKIEDKIQFNKNEEKKYWKRIIASAAVLFLLLGTVLLSLIIENNITQIAAKGEKREFELNDGSKIFLNSGSTITYPENFKEDRRITLEGEAFFKVAPNPEKPFRIKSGTIETKVLGTSFNINAYAKGREKISVNSGIVQVTYGDNSSQKVTLTKNMQLSFFEGNLPAITEMNSENYNAWTNNIIVLDKTSLGETAKILENWYDVDIEFADPSLKELTISGKFKEEKLETVLKSIALIKDLEVDHNNPKSIIIREQKEKFN
ncbi:FecR domain-containing protein [Salegentibacter mishustinae]|uniref:FecR family protein n=1 Tax=Salegentibacter mishustinae TaxID=270918 RepID=UPI001CE07301|nr:FecR domain-containing protein [Salegentibacter mishustinae]UBZ07931.1 FecR domain-containing protein [Salegentibacter mishustinae]